MPGDDALDSLELNAAGAQLEIAPGVGGSLARFTFRGTDVLRPADGAARDAQDVLRYASYPLVPYSNRIAHARLTVNGREHALRRNFGEHPHSIHGVGWQSVWSVDAVAKDHALLSLDYSPSPEVRGQSARETAWPWAFRAVQSFALAAIAGGVRLATRMTLVNTSDTAFPFGLGFHPFFLRGAHTLLGFKAQGMWESDATLMPTKLVAPIGALRFDPPQRVGEHFIDNVYTGWDGTATVSDPERGIAVTIEADGACTFLVVYVPLEHDFVCVEPVTHMTDAFNLSARGETATGARMLPPGAAFSTTMHLCVRALAR